MSEHTKGTWKVVGSGETLFVDGPFHANIDPVEDVRHSIATVTGPDRAANARIIAAAPKLLGALKTLRSFMWSEGYADQTAVMAQADAAIAKAEAANDQS